MHNVLPLFNCRGRLIPFLVISLTIIYFCIFSDMQVEPIHRLHLERKDGNLMIINMSKMEESNLSLKTKKKVKISQKINAIRFWIAFFLLIRLVSKRILRYFVITDWSLPYEMSICHHQQAKRVFYHLQ